MAEKKLTLHLDFRSGLPIYTQIVNQVQAQVAGGILKPDDQLPTVWALAEELRVNFNTVARAYRILDEARIISTQQGRGTYITDEFLDEIRERGIDLIVSVAAPTIFRRELIDLPPLGCINIHHAPLPRYKGMMPNFWQLYHGEKTVGITIHKINPRIDEGEIILQKEVAVIPGESLDALIKRTKRLGAHCMAEAIEMVRSGGVQPVENRTDQASYFSFPTKQDVHKFRQMGYRLL